MRLHYLTVIIVIIAVCPLLWLNTHPPTDWKLLTANNQLHPPKTLDPLSKAMFYKGWPLSPCMFCSLRNLRWDPDDVGGVYFALLIDIGVILVVGVVSGLISEFCIRRFQKRKRDTSSWEPHPPGTARL
jgi:hypothetical protein